MRLHTSDDASLPILWFLQNGPNASEGIFTGKLNLCSPRLLSTVVVCGVLSFPNYTRRLPSTTSGAVYPVSVINMLMAALWGVVRKQSTWFFYISMRKTCAERCVSRKNISFTYFFT